jgi:CD109 antigen
MSEEFGIGMTPEPLKLTVFKKFFVSLDLPYSMKVGEAIDLPITVFNYLGKDVQATIKLHNENNEFLFVEKGGARSERTEELRTVQIKSEKGRTETILIYPKKAGTVTIKVTATTGEAGDGIEKLLLVKPVGITEYKNKPVFVNLKPGFEKNADISIDIPADAVPDSAKIETSVHSKYFECYQITRSYGTRLKFD